jgi:hypothetical protein
MRKKMSKFIRGDRVRFVEPAGFCVYINSVDMWEEMLPPCVGDEGEVMDIIPGAYDDDHYVVVYIDKPGRETNGRDNGWRFLDAWLSLVEED